MHERLAAIVGLAGRGPVARFSPAAHNRKYKAMALCSMVRFDVDGIWRSKHFALIVPWHSGLPSFLQACRLARTTVLEDPCKCVAAQKHREETIDHRRRRCAGIRNRTMYWRAYEKNPEVRFHATQSMPQGTGLGLTSRKHRPLRSRLTLWRENAWFHES